MNKKIIPYHVVDLPPGRRVMADMPSTCIGGSTACTACWKWMSRSPRQFIEEHKVRTGEQLSFTGYLTFCLARAVDEDKAVQAYLKGRKQLVVFDDVDVGLMIERKIGDKRALMGHVIRGANHKTYREIHQEIRSVQSKPVPPSRGMPSWFQSAVLLPPGRCPGWFRCFALIWPCAVTRRFSRPWQARLALPRWVCLARARAAGGWLPVTHGLDLVVGGIAWKPAVVEGRIEPREILNLTVVFDHDVIDGAPAARFTRRLVELIESGYGLD